MQFFKPFFPNSERKN